MRSIFVVLLTSLDFRRLSVFLCCVAFILGCSFHAAPASSTRWRGPLRPPGWSENGVWGNDGLMNPAPVRKQHTISRAFLNFVIHLARVSFEPTLCSHWGISRSRIFPKETRGEKRDSTLICLRDWPCAQTLLTSCHH